MSKKQKKKIPWQQYVGMGGAVLTGAVCGAFSVSYFDKLPQDTPLYHQLLFLAGLFLGLYAALLFHIIVHEAGHLLFGRLTGYTFSSFRIGSFMWRKEKEKFSLKRLSIAGTGGQCLMVPPDIKNGKLPVVLYNLGGSFVNILFGLLFLAGYLLFPQVPFVSPFLLIFAAVGLMMAGINGVPMRMGTVDNDGYNALALSKNKEAVEAFWVQLKVNEQSSRGVRLKDMPAQWFTVPTDAAMKNSMVAARGVFACNRLMDEERFEEADRLMAHLLAIESGIVGLHHDLLVCDRIYLELVGEGRPEAIEALLNGRQKKFMKAMKRFPTVLRTEYALALLWENNAARAEKLGGEFERLAKNYPYPQEMEAERALIEKARQIKIERGEKEELCRPD